MTNIINDVPMLAHEVGVMFVGRLIATVINYGALIGMATLTGHQRYRRGSLH